MRPSRLLPYVHLCPYPVIALAKLSPSQAPLPDQANEGQLRVQMDCSMQAWPRPRLQVSFPLMPAEAAPPLCALPESGNVLPMPIPFLRSVATADPAHALRQYALLASDQRVHQARPAIGSLVAYTPPLALMPVLRLSPYVSVHTRCVRYDPVRFSPAIVRHRRHATCQALALWQCEYSHSY